MNATLFAFFKGAISNGDDTDPETSASFYNPPMSAMHNVVWYRRETVELDAAETRSVTIPNYAASQWVGFMARVVGEATLTTVGTDWDGSTPIEGKTAGYGTDRHPGYISLVSTNISTFTLTSLAADTQIEYLMMILEADDNL